MALFSPYDFWQMENYQGMDPQAPGGWAGQGGYLGPTPQGGFPAAPTDAYADASGNAPDAAPIGPPAFTPAPMQPGPAAPAAPTMPQAPGLGGIGAQSMIGLGMGLLAATPFNRMGQALQGYQAGVSLDEKRREAAASEAYRRQELALRQEQLRREPEAVRQLRAMGIDPTSPQAREMLYPKTTGQFIQIGTDFWGNPQHGFVDLAGRTVTPYDSRTGRLGTPQSLDAPKYSGGQAVPFVGAQGQATPPTTGIGGPASLAAPVAAPPAGPLEPPSLDASAAEHEAYLRQNPQLDPKAYRAALTKEVTTRAGTAEEKQRNAANALNAIGDAQAIIGEHPFRTAGAWGKVESGLPGTPAYDLKAAIETIKTGATREALQAMREGSPTGATALGRVTQMEFQMLGNSIASLDQYQSHEAFARNLGRVQRQMYDIAHGAGSFDYDQKNGAGAYARAVATGQVTPRSVAQAMKAGDQTYGGGSAQTSGAPASVATSAPKYGTKEYWRQKLREQGVNVP
jgi:hypothetical protein